MKHITGLAHIALFTKDLETSVKFYECLGGKVTGQADVAKPLGTNHIKIVSMPGTDVLSCFLSARHHRITYALYLQIMFTYVVITTYHPGFLWKL